MRLPQFSNITGAVLVGVVLGLILAPSLRQAGPANASPAQGKSAATYRTSSITDTPGNTPSRTRARDREPAKKNDDPCVSIPVKTVVALLHEARIFHSQDFTALENWMNLALEALGASKTDSDEIKDMVKKSKDEIYAAEKAHFKLGLVTPDHIEIDTSGMQEPVSTIIGRLKDGIHATLNPEAAEALVSTIDWKKYYPLEGKFITSLEITRDPYGELNAWVKVPGRGTGTRVDKKFPNDGTPLPADQVFPEHLRPLLKGLTLIPKDGEI